MTTIKTPAEIAAWLTDPTGDESSLLRDLPDSRKPEVAEAIVAAIEADRAQRAADIEMLANAASHWATELTDYVIDASVEAGDEESAEAQRDERDELQEALGRYLSFKEGN